MRLEIWLTDLDVDPDVSCLDGVVRVRLRVTESLEQVLKDQGHEVPEPLRDHLIQLWAGECTPREFKVIDNSTLLISSPTNFNL